MYNTKLNRSDQAIIYMNHFNYAAKANLTDNASEIEALSNQ